MSFPALLLLIAFAFATYTVGAGLIEGQANHRTWRLLASADGFRAYHQAVGPRVVALLVGLFGIGLAATLGWQMPAQRRLDRDGNSGPIVEGLIAREWVRLVPHLLKALLMMWLVAGMFVAQKGM